MKIALAQISTNLGNIEANTNKILEYINKAKTAKADLIVFPELCLSGNPACEIFNHKYFIDNNLQNMKIVADFAKNISIFASFPKFCINKDGKNLLNTAYLLQNKEVLKEVSKYELTNSRGVYESSCFARGNGIEVHSLFDKKILFSIGDDISKNEIHIEIFLKKNKPEIIINVSAIPFGASDLDERVAYFERIARKYNATIINVNASGAQTELIFEGNSLIAQPDGTLYKLCAFEDDFFIFDTDKKIEQNYLKNENKIELIHDALIFGIREYFKTSGLKQAILGLSGGIDSAVVAYLACQALGSENVVGLLMPSEFSSQHSVDDALDLARNLRMKHHTIPIKDVFFTINETLALVFVGKPFDVTEENIQARVRGLLLMAYSNKFGNILLNTSNKSEFAVGYGTLYGDLCGGLSVIADIYKTQVYKLAEYINREMEIIPKNTVNKPPSAELRPDQKDSDSLPDYDKLDKILYLYIEKSNSPENIINNGFEKNLVNRIIKMVNGCEHKRHQTPPTLCVSEKPFSLSRKIPVAAKF